MKSLRWHIDRFTTNRMLAGMTFDCGPLPPRFLVVKVAASFHITNTTHAFAVAARRKQEADSAWKMVYGRSW